MRLLNLLYIAKYRVLFVFLHFVISSLHKYYIKAHTKSNLLLAGLTFPFTFPLNLDYQFDSFKKLFSIMLLAVVCIFTGWLFGSNITPTSPMSSGYEDPLVNNINSNIVILLLLLTIAYTLHRCYSIPNKDSSLFLLVH